MPHHYGLGAALARSGGGMGAGSPLTRMLLRELGPGVRGALDESPLMDAIKSLPAQSPRSWSQVSPIPPTLQQAQPPQAPPLSVEERLRSALTNPELMQQVSSLFQPQGPPQFLPTPPTAFPVFGQFPPLQGGIFG